MRPEPFAIPEAVRARARSEGKAGHVWLNSLQEVLADLAEAWSFCPGELLAGGSAALIVAVEMNDGRDVVLKLGTPGSAKGRREALVLEHAGGRGYVQLLRHDPLHRAFLLERLGPSLDTENAPVDTQIDRLCTALGAAWRPCPHDLDLIDGHAKAADLADYLNARIAAVGSPCSSRAVNLAFRYAQERSAAFDPSAAVLAHGDPHAANLLGDPGNETYRFVDPDGLRIEPAYDLGVVLRHWNAELLAGGADATTITARFAHRLNIVTNLNGVAPEPIRQWSFIERLTTAMVLLELGQDEETRPYFTVADALAAVTA